MVRTGASLMVAAGLATAGLAFATSGTAGALPNCGGNNDVKVAPLTCTNTRTIDGTTVTVVLDVTAAGVMTIEYTLDPAPAVDIPIRVRAHRGISSNPGTHEVEGVIRAGTTSGVLVVQNNCGQVDVKAVFTGNGDARGRVAGPFITTADNCSSTPATTAPTTAPPTSAGGGSTTPTSESGTTCPVCTTTSGGSALSNRTLPETGSNGRLLLVLSAGLVVGGVVLITTGRARGVLHE
jgi:hypothetical protein